MYVCVFPWLQEVVAAKLPPVSLRRIMRLNSPELPHIIVGCIAAIFAGAYNPVFAVILSEILGVNT